jgi:diguanylate cyclase (GGDEF)-like protein
VFKTWTRSLVALCLLTPSLGPAPAVAQQFSFTTLTAGLGNLDVNCIAQDASGYIWVGTENGLYRYDGRSFRQFGTAQGLHGHMIQSLFAAPDGTLFVGTTTGIFFERHDGAFAPIHPPAPVAEFSQRIGSVFTAVAPDQIVTADRSGAFSLRRTAPDNWIAQPLYLDGKTIWSALAAPDGTLWYGCDSDLCQLKRGKTTHLHATLNLPEDHWLHLLRSADGHIWARGSAHLGEIIPAESRFVEHDLPGQPNGVPYAELTKDAHGRVVAAQGASLGIWDNGAWRMITPANGLSRYDISNLFVDREGSMWIGVVGHGLMRWVGQDQWEAYNAANGLSDDIVWASLRDRSGRLWIGTESGVNYIGRGETTPKTWQHPGIQTTRAVALAETPDGGIWIGSAAGNLVRIDPKTLSATQWKVPEVFRILSDGDHRLWIATGSGLFVFDTAVRGASPQPVLDTAIAHPHQRFTDLSVPSNQDQPAQNGRSGSATLLWAASDDGLLRMDASGWHRIDPGLSGIVPSVIAADSGGNLWAAGAFPGVVRLRIVGDKVQESQHIARPHLLSERVVSIAVDHRGWIWFGQDAGVTVFDKQTWRGFTQDDGLVWNDADGYALNEDSDGTMWIGTSGGLAHLLRPQGMASGTPPAAVFSQVTFGSNPVASESEIPWSASPLVVDLASLSYRDASHIRIRYRLLGVESEWVETAERSLRYPRLEPGPYRFQAIVVDQAGNGGQAQAAEAVSPIAEFSFVITPRWWQSGPLRLAFMLMLALGVVLAWRWSVHLLVRQKRILESAVQHRTEDLETEKAELLRAREQMRHFAEHDDLTGAWNHRIIMERLRQEVDRSLRERSPVSVILVDLDHFKNINDTYGHPAGDLVLREVGAIFQRSVRSYDWVGRYGGEEFLLILPGSGSAGARVRAEQLRMAVQWAHIHDGTRAIPVTASFGVATGFSLHPETLVQAADAALYRAKDNGRNCVISTEIEPGEEPEMLERKNA